MKFILQASFVIPPGAVVSAIASVLLPPRRAVGDEGITRRLVTLRLMMHACPSGMALDTAGSTSVPVLWFHTPVVSSWPALKVTVRS